MKVLLINPICYDNEKKFIEDSERMNINADEPLHLYSLQSYVEKNMDNIKIDVYDHHFHCLKKSYDNQLDSKFHTDILLWHLLITKINIFKPDVVGVSGLYEYNKDFFHKTLKVIKEVNKDIITVVGGLYVTTNDLSFDKNIDYSIKGEGECSFAILLEHISKKEYHKIKKNGWITGTILQNLDNYVNYNRNNIGLYNIYARQAVFRFFEKVKTITIQVDRGCPNSCKFCSGYNITMKKFRHRSIESIIEEINYYIYNYEIRTFIFNSENACNDVNFSKELFKAVIPLKIKWMHNGGFYVNKMDQEFVNLAIDSGIIMFNLAIESGSKRILKLMKKPTTIIDKIKQVVDWIREKNNDIYLLGFFMFGFAEETWKDVNDSISLMKKLDLNWYQINMLQIFKGCQLYNEYLDKGLIKIKENNNNHYLESKVINKNGINTKKLNKYIYEKVNIDLNFKNNRDFKKGNYYQVIRDMEHVLEITNGKHKEAKKLLNKSRKKLNKKYRNENENVFI